ncbi:MAG: cysteine--tRNA ligase [Candidatus Hodarchaeales archaeon]|jgi:cysteinyl-tRNA synthetase
MTLKLYNSLSKSKEKFIPLAENKITLYTCGMTVYDVTHVGHAKTYSTWDILKKYLRYRFSDHKIIHVQNYTDVGHLTDDADEGEDKILKRAIRNKVNPMELVDKYIRSFEDDMRDLDIEFPNISPRATGHIVEMIDFVQQLLDKGVAYETERGIYFDITKYPQYAEFTNINLEKQKTGARVEEDKSKRNPFDFALYIKSPKDHIMQWETPWGWQGYPGWHIECSTMAMKYLGENLDIHTGGIEHLSIHHPNERAQSEALTEKKWVNIWLHANHMTLNGEKMAKSTGNYISTRDAINKYSANFLRYYLIVGSHYRSQEDFTVEKISQKWEEFQKILTLMSSLEMIRQSKQIQKNELGSSETALQLKKKFLEAMDDDLNTPLAGNFILKFVNHLNKILESKTINFHNLFSDYKIFLEIASLLVIKPPEKSKEHELVNLLIEMRKEARKSKEYQKADEIRDKITKLGYKLEDKPWGTIAIDNIDFL